jgi:hydrogenase-4 component F
MSIAFVFLLVGYGTKVGLVPMHQLAAGCALRRPDAHVCGAVRPVAECRPVCPGTLKMLVDGSLAATATRPSGRLPADGLRPALLPGGRLFLHRQRDIKRMFSYSSIEHMGLMTFAFGLGGPLATFGALLHMLVHSLTKSAIFVTVGHAAHIAGSQSIDRIRGLIRTQPAVGWGLLIGWPRPSPASPLSACLPANSCCSPPPCRAQPWLTVAAGPVWRWLSQDCSATSTHGLRRRPEGQAPVQANMLPVYPTSAWCCGWACRSRLSGRWLDRATS